MISLQKEDAFNFYKTGLSADGVMIQLVQNFFIFFSDTMFWLTYVPFYERLFPVFVTNQTQEESSRSRKAFNIRFKLPRIGGFKPRSFEAKGEQNYEISFSRFSDLLRAFANSFGIAKRLDI